MTMKKFINAPDSFVDEALEGIVMAHEDKVMLYPADSRVVDACPKRSAGKQSRDCYWRRIRTFAGLPWVCGQGPGRQLCSRKCIFIPQQHADFSCNAGSRQREGSASAVWVLSGR